jgi:hypothetical protein
MLQNNFRPGHPIARISAAFLNKVANILNYLRIETTDSQFPSIEKPENPSTLSPWVIKIPRSGGGSSGEFYVAGRVELIQENSAYRLVQHWDKVTVASTGITVERDVVNDHSSYAFEHTLYSHADEHAEGVIKEAE